MNVGGIRPYIERCKEAKPASYPAGPATRKASMMETYTQMQEMMMVGLRLTQAGISKTDFADRFGRSLEEVFGTDISHLVQAGLLEWADQDCLRLTGRGRLLGNQVFMQFVS
jgi:oxygen-independent coproporphyrinogen-3 oxidase